MKLLSTLCLSGVMLVAATATFSAPAAPTPASSVSVTVPPPTPGVGGRRDRQQLDQNRQQLESRGGRAAAAVNAASNQGTTGTSVVIGQVASEALN